MRILIIDIDGVLLPGHALLNQDNLQIFEEFKRGYSLLSIGERLIFPNEYVDRLNTIVNNTGCKLVVISTWRKTFTGYHGIPNIIDVLEAKGLKREWFHSNPICPYKLTSSKQNEVDFWLSEYATEDTDWLIIDDDEIFHLDSPERSNLILTKFETGLTEDKMREILAIWS